ncbi:MGMT family protein [Flammeovirga pacifica]|uniref:Cysteine methyltransferase n=1 Tax=Flammeovirga pacifica TaxID=915059 RepID=A0A1S1YW54_FLAPC|nr:MGMT family protein [Flammeovirga pacifica]OHX65240.1 cysteine methyltransferase [Flammeovirga pacifica]
MSEKNNNFFQDVWEVVKLIPKGRVASYGDIAAYLGSKNGARMVGWAMNASHMLEDVPAHRVVNKKGLLTGKHHFDETNKMQTLLENEGIEIIDNQIQDLDKVKWNPNTELL